MPSLLDRLLGRDKKEEPKKKAPQRVSEDAARKRREELAAEKEAMKKARERAEESEKARLDKLEEEGKTKAAAKPTASGKTYTVKGGDSLSKIAKEVLGDAKRWPEIYELNKELIGDNPNIIHPGQELKLPA
jgi:nucleoid-associated protein YgaU